jgi:hypothetical protein
MLYIKGYQIQTLTVIFCSSFIFKCRFDGSTFDNQYSTKLSPMLIEPEMTEIWEPEIKIVTTGKQIREHLRMPLSYSMIKYGLMSKSKKIILKLLTWKIVDNNYIEVSLMLENSNYNFWDCQLHMSGVLLMLL